MSKRRRLYGPSFFRYQEHCKRYDNIIKAELASKPRDIKIYVFYGVTGAGKSTSLRLGLSESLYEPTKGDHPWDHYNGEPNVLFDEFGSNDEPRWKLDEFLNFLDGTKCQLDARYSNCFALWTNVFITSNSHPDTWYKERKPALQRRLDDYGQIFYMAHKYGQVAWVNPLTLAGIIPAPFPLP